MRYQDEVPSEDGHKEGQDAPMSRYVEKETRGIEPKVALEYTIPTSQKLMALGIYFLCNVGLTLYNKAVLGSVSESPSPGNESPYPVALDEKGLIQMRKFKC